VVKLDNSVHPLLVERWVVLTTRSSKLLSIDDFNGKFGIGGIGDIFLLYRGVN
jgi:hypothetical protein